MKQQTKVTSYIVLIPAYNEESSIEQALDAVYAASLETPKELIKIVVCLNGCTDRTEEIALAWNKAPLKIIHSEPGFLNAMNKLISYAHRHYGQSAFVKTDADSILDKDAFKYLFEQFDSHKEIIVAGGHPYPSINKTFRVGADLSARYFLSEDVILSLRYLLQIHSSITNLQIAILFLVSVCLKND